MKSNDLKPLKTLPDAGLRASNERLKRCIAEIFERDGKLSANVAGGAPDTEIFVVRAFEQQVPHDDVRSADALATGIEEKLVERSSFGTSLYVRSTEALRPHIRDAPLDIPDLLISNVEDRQDLGVHSSYKCWRDIGKIADLEAERSEFDRASRG